VGYYGRDVESMVRDLVENAIGLVRERQREGVRAEAERRAEERLVDLLSPSVVEREETEGEAHDRTSESASERRSRTREKMRKMLAAGLLEDRPVELQIEQRQAAMMVPGLGPGQMDVDLQGMLEKIMPKQTIRREMKVSEARKVLFEQESDALINPEKLHAEAIELTENLGILFVDELDKVVASDSRGADVSRQGVQRDLLPIVEGTTVQTKYGQVKTDHILFVAAGAFHKSSPGDLMPELQGRFPIRVELKDLTKDDFVRILKEPTNSLTKQYAALLGTEGVELSFSDDGVEALADYAFQLNQSQQNIGARRLYTIMERLLEELSFAAPEMKSGRVPVNAAYVHERLSAIAKDQDLSQFIL
jgi:ATP-dependent HslUV protease ATP-binding subunit HslU